MADHAPFHVQLDEHLRRRYWTPHDLLSAMHAMNGRSAGVVACLEAGQPLDEIQAILRGNLAPTESLGELIADLVIGIPDELSEQQCRERESLVGAAYVAECHGRRQQPPYTHGVIGESQRSNSAGTVDQSDVRQAKVRDQRRRRLLARLVELEERQFRQRARRTASGRRSSSNPFAPGRSVSRGPERSAQRFAKELDQARQRWSDAAIEALAYRPPTARRDCPDECQSFLHVLSRSFDTGRRFHEFLESLLVTWRAEGRSRRGREQTRMSPEQLGAWIGGINHRRYIDDSEKQAWFQRHKGPAITGSSLRNYLAGISERPQRECIQKLLWALVPPGDVQIRAEQRLWRMSRIGYPIEPRRCEELLELLTLDWDSPLVRRQVGNRNPRAQARMGEARVVTVLLGNDSNAFQALADSKGVLLTPLIHPPTQCIAADIAAIDPETGALLTPIDLALATDDRGAIMRALLDFSGMPIMRVAELTEVHETLFQQWMREGRNRRIENRNRARRIVELLNPPELARWPIEPGQIRLQNELAVRLLTTRVCTLGQALRDADECVVPETLQLDAEKEKTFRAAVLLRQVFGKDSLSNLTGAEVGRRLAARKLGDAQSFKHLREGVRARGKKSARRATLEQAYFLASLLEETVGPLEDSLRKQFVERVACMELAPRGEPATPAELMKRVENPADRYSVRNLIRELMRRHGGLVRFSRHIGVSQQTLRAFISRDNHYLHHPVSRRIAERGLGFSPGSEEHRRFVVLSTAAWRRGTDGDHVRLSGIFRDYSNCLVAANNSPEQRAVRARLLGRLLAQAALSPRELAELLQVTPAMLAGWTTARSGRFSSQEALKRFVELMQYEEEQIDFIQEAFGPLNENLVSCHQNSDGRPTSPPEMQL